MKIGIIIKNYATVNEFSKTGMPTKGGADFHAENQAKQLISLGHNVYIMSKRSKYKLQARENYCDIDVVRLHAPFRWLESILRLVSTHSNTDVFYIFGNPEFAVWPVLFAKLIKKRTILILTQNEPINVKNTWRNRILCKCDKYIAISNSIKQIMNTQMHVPENKISVLPQGVDITIFNGADNAEKNELREKEQIHIGHPIVLFCARISLVKGVDTMQKAWRKVHSKRPDALLVVVGGGDKHLVADIINTGQELEHSIRFIGEVLDTSIWYKIADIYFFPSRGEGLPTSLMEALASGVPSVVSKVSGCEDLLFDDQNGYLVESEDAETMAERILYLLDNKEVCDRMAKWARKYACEYLDSSVLKYKLEQIVTKDIHRS